MARVYSIIKLEEKEMARLYRVKKVTMQELAIVYGISVSKVREILIRHDAIERASPHKEQATRKPMVDKAKAEDGNPMEMAKMLLADQFTSRGGALFYKGKHISGMRCWHERIIPDLNAVLVSDGREPVKWPR